MITNINLLPTDITGSKNVIQTSKRITQISMVLGVLFLFTGIVGGIYTIYLQGQISTSQAQQENLISQIQSLSESEQQYTLVRDRVDKIKPIIEKKGVDDYIVDLENLVQFTPSNTDVTEVDFSDNEIELTYVVRNSADLISIFASFVGNSYENFIVEEFSYNPVVGYIVNVRSKFN